ncbi:MAG: site-specific DNA-methyltransferase [Elusimicrobiota bacterium]
MYLFTRRLYSCTREKYIQEILFKQTGLEIMRTQTLTPTATTSRMTPGTIIPQKRLATRTASSTSTRIPANKIANSLFEGDCLEVLKKFPDSSVDMVLCDLPYGTTQNKWDSVIDLEKLWEAYLRIVKPNGAIVLTAQGIFTAKLILSNEKHFKYKITWEKSKPTNFLNAKIQPLRKHEDICVFYREQPAYNPQMGEGSPYDKGVRKDQLSGSYGDFLPRHIRSEGGRYPTDVVYFKTAESEGTVWHPTQKPVDLGRYLIRTYTNPGDIVLDNSFGSGSFLVAAALEGRNFCGIEKNEDVQLFKKNAIDYIDIAQARLADAFNKKSKKCRVNVYRANSDEE